MRTLSILATASLALSLLAACAPATQTSAPTAQSPEAACTARGGAIKPVGRMQMPTCVVPYADAGKSCTDKSQCEGACILQTTQEPEGPVTGQCQQSSSQFGCFAKVENGKATHAMCVD
jgi:hypothetical protein